VKDMPIETYRDPIFIKWYNASEERTNEQYKVVRGKVILNEIPDEFHGVQINGFVRLKTGQVPTSANEFVVSNWSIGELTFHESKEGDFITVTKYYARGCVFYPASRIYSKISNDDVAET